MLLKDLNARSVTQLSSSAIDSWLVVVILYPTDWLVSDSLTMEYVMSNCDSTCTKNNPLIVITKNNLLRDSQCCNNEVNLITTLRSEKTI